jgi:hypothetical protein
MRGAVMELLRLGPITLLSVKLRRPLIFYSALETAM